MRVAVAGCIHGELDSVYRDVAALEQQHNYKVDLVLICGDVQTLRNENDLQCMAVKNKFKRLGDFHKYYSGEREAPILTLFIGGNHEASNYLMTLPYGGWVCPKIYYMGYANVVRFNGLRIAAISGIYSRFHKNWGHFERLPFSEDTKRSIYHTRNLETYRLLQITRSGEEVDIFMSHDWPLNIHSFGDVDNLLRIKPYFRADIANGSLGNPLCQTILENVKPKHWFAAHLHVRFEATVNHDDGKSTNFLALDKCLPRRPYLEIIEVEASKPTTNGLEYDPEWIAILKNTNEFLSIDKQPKTKIPGFWVPLSGNFKKDTEKLRTESVNLLKIPENFEKSSPVCSDKDENAERTINYSNPQTTLFCQQFEITDPNQLIVDSQQFQSNPDEICLSDEEIEDQDDLEHLSKKLKNCDEIQQPTAQQVFVIDRKGANK